MPRRLECLVKNTDGQEARYLLEEYGKKEAEVKLVARSREVEGLKSKLQSALSDQIHLESELRKARGEVAELEVLKK